MRQTETSKHTAECIHCGRRTHGLALMHLIGEERDLWIPMCALPCEHRSKFRPQQNTGKALQERVNALATKYGPPPVDHIDEHPRWRYELGDGDGQQDAEIVELVAAR